MPDKIKMTVDDLIRQHTKHCPASHFFDEDTLNWFGEHTWSMRVLKCTKEFRGHECIVLSSYQSKSPFEKKWQHYYFDKDTFKYVGARPRE